MNKLRLAIIFIILAITSYKVGAANNASMANNDTLKLLNLFGEVFEKVKKEYVVEPTDKELIEASLNGMLSSLDPHSGYFTEKEFEEMNVHIKGEFGGLGIETTMESGVVKVIAPINDAPAYRAGVKSGDYVIAIDNEPVLGLTISEAVKKMRGKPGTKVHLTILREDSKEPVEIDVVREIIKPSPVRAKIESDNIAYVRVNTFVESTTDEVRKELENVKNTIGKELAGVVLDLRNNPGGLFDQAKLMADLFIDTGEIVSTRGRQKKDIVRYYAKEKDVINKDIPMVVLINSGSASSSEIVAGALQDHKRAVVMGTTSFGKGSVQVMMSIPGFGGIKMTTARYYTPSGRSIQAEGIVPDITVEQAQIIAPEGKGNKNFSESWLKGHLENEKKKIDSKDKTVKKSDDTATNKEKSGKKIILKEAANAAASKDYQLARAIDLLKGLAVIKKQ
jgi:carboxyl-terminal processing protease